MGFYTTCRVFQWKSENEPYPLFIKVLLKCSTTSLGSQKHSPKKQIDGNFLIFRLNYIPWKYQKNASFRTFSGPEQ